MTKSKETKWEQEDLAEKRTGVGADGHKLDSIPLSRVALEV
tara:strand:- start:6532 stop:6654 length:123 start_codon:yes stop_codon:yes gene_type:complete